MKVLCNVAMLTAVFRQSVINKSGRKQNDSFFFPPQGKTQQNLTETNHKEMN